MYENYAATTQNYDLTRTPIGVEVLLGCFATAQNSLSQLEILDAGCGTASYSLALLPYVRRIVGVDACQEMIECAQKKAKHAAISTDRLSFHQASMESLPFDDSCFDGVMINQVLHHLEDGSDDGFPLLHTVLTDRLGDQSVDPRVQTLTRDPESLHRSCFPNRLVESRRGRHFRVAPKKGRHSVP